jgi:molybdate transport system substrate-binding protein
VAQLFQTLGIDQAMAAKSVLVNGGLAAEAVADGRADMALQQISELMAVPGVTLAGPLPAAIQQQTIYAGALSAATPSRDAAQAFLEAMADPSVWPVLQAHALTPP